MAFDITQPHGTVKTSSGAQYFFQNGVIYNSTYGVVTGNLDESFPFYAIGQLDSVTGAPIAQKSLYGAALTLKGSATAIPLLTTTATGVTVGNAVLANGGRGTFHAVATGSNTLSATILIQVSDDNVNFLTVGTITLSGTTPQQDGFPMDSPWTYVRANVTAFSQSAGTDKSLTITMGN